MKSTWGGQGKINQEILGVEEKYSQKSWEVR
jgi:hypothetical protein